MQDPIAFELLERPFARCGPYGEPVRIGDNCASESFPNCKLRICDRQLGLEFFSQIGANGAAPHAGFLAQRHKKSIILDAGDYREELLGFERHPSRKAGVSHAFSRRAARTLAKSSPAWWDERVSGLAATITNPF